MTAASAPQPSDGQAPAEQADPHAPSPLLTAGAEQLGPPRVWVRAAQGAALALGAPLGWLGLRVLGGASPLDDIAAHPLLYTYLLVATTAAFALFGTLLGAREDALYALNTALAERSVTDSLTGLKNHQYFFARLGEELSRHRREDKPLSLVVMDLDHFKQVNDTHGHPAGDRVLAAVADAGRDVLRREDTLARLGGEEFGFLLPGLDLDAAMEVAERVQQAIESVRVPLDSGAALRVKVSIGVASAVQASTDAAELYARVDAALYDAKVRGRDQIATR